MSKNIIASAAIGLSLFALGVVGSKAQGSNSTLTKELILKTGTYNSLLKTGAQSSNYTYTLPITTPTANQVLTATAVSGTNITFGWSSAGGGGGVTYGPASTQNTLTPVTTKLFDVSYASASGNAAGAQITSSTTSGTSVGLQVSAAGTTNVIGAMLSATGGSTNYALIVPASSGNVGIGNNAPGSLLSVGSSGQLTVNTSGNLATSGTVVVTGGSLSLGSAATAPELRFYEPSAGGSEYSSIKAQAQGATVNYILPTTAPGGNDRALVVSNIAGSDVTLKWSTAAPGTGNSTVNTVRLDANLTDTDNSWDDITGASFSVSANASYRFEILFVSSQASPGQDCEIRFVGPSGATNTYGIIPLAANSASNVFVRNEAESTTKVLRNNGTNAISAWQITGLATIAGTAGTWKVQFRKKAGEADLTLYSGTYVAFTN